MESPKVPDDTGAHYRMSWTAYVKPGITFIILSLVSLTLISVVGWYGGVFMLFWLGLFVVQILTIRSVVLYMDEQGVWVYSGIFPWSKGTRGVKWRDVEDAVYYPNFLSWLLKSYTVRVGHRFTKSSEIVLSHVARGNDAVVHINSFHRNVLSAASVGEI